MDYQKMIETMTPQTYRALRTAVEIGKWPNGEALSAEQREHCMSAVIAWDHRHAAEQDRVGFIDRGHKQDGEMCGDNPADTDQAIRWTDA